MFIHHVSPTASVVIPEGESLNRQITKFLEAETPADVLQTFEDWKSACESHANPDTSNSASEKTREPYETYTLLRDQSRKRSHRLRDFWDLMELRFAAPEYQPLEEDENARTSIGKRVLIAGAGPAGLKAAVEACLMKCERVAIAESRDSFTRLNALRVHKEDLDDLIQKYGAKDFYRKLGNEEFQVISTRRLQLLLLKMALILGAEVFMQSSVNGLSPSNPSTSYWTASVATTSATLPAYAFNILIIASGEKSDLASQLGFEHSEFGTNAAIGIVCNYEPGICDAQAGGVISWAAKSFFDKLLKEKGVELENQANYPTEDSHYLVVTAKIPSLLSRGVVKQDCGADRAALLRPENVDREAMEAYMRDIATALKIPEDRKLLTLQTSHGEQTDIAIFDFSKRVTAIPAAKVITENANVDGGKDKSLVVALVGDALVTPFWPQGTGWAKAAHGVMSLVLGLKELGPVERWKEREEGVLGRLDERYRKLKADTYVC
ncbi:[F-actin]-monooxygenase mical3 [Rhizophlyctis rosea]|nr:[F-actin]-monooxygenase mical3 [Rhizophlyctis rosea]